MQTMNYISCIFYCCCCCCFFNVIEFSMYSYLWWWWWWLKLLLLLLLLLLICKIYWFNCEWFSLSTSESKTWNLGGKDGFHMERTRPWEGFCRKESYFLEFMYVDVAKDFVGVIFHVFLDGAKDPRNHRDCCCFDPPHSLNLDFQVFVFVIESFSVVWLMCWCRGVYSCQRVPLVLS